MAEQQAYASVGGIPTSSCVAIPTTSSAETEPAQPLERAGNEAIARLARDIGGHNDPRVSRHECTHAPLQRAPGAVETHFTAQCIVTVLETLPCRA